MPAAAPVASLPMYDWPEIAWATDALWSAIVARLARGGMEAPPSLDRTRPLDDVWRDPNLLLSQTCGYPYATSLKGIVRLIGTPVYAVEGCEGPLYSSAVVVRRGEGERSLAELSRRIAFNSRDSLSGYVTLLAWLRGNRSDPAAAGWIETGSHRASLRALASRDADLAAIDAVCWTLAQRHEPAAAAMLEVIGWTSLRPGVPLITAGGRGDAETSLIRDAVAEAMADPALGEARRALVLSGLAQLMPAEYEPLRSVGASYPEDSRASRG